MSKIFQFINPAFYLPKNKLDKHGKTILLQSIVALLLEQRFEIFKNEGGEEKWEPLPQESENIRINKIRDTRIKNLAKKGKPIPDKMNIGKKSIKILQDKGILRQSFTNASGAGNAYRYSYVTEDEAAIETHLPYAAIQNFGGTIKPKNARALSFPNSRGKMVFARSVTIPARPFNKISKSNEKEIEKLIQWFISEG